MLKPTRESVVNAFGKIGGVLYIRSKHNDTPKIVYSIRKTCQNRGLYFDNKRYFPAIEKVRESHGDETLEYIYEQAKQAKSWTQFISVIEELIEDNQDQEED